MGLPQKLFYLVSVCAWGEGREPASSSTAPSVSSESDPYFVRVGMIDL